MTMADDLERKIDPASRRRGCLLGGAIGDALGAPVEFLSLDEIRGQLGADGVHDFLPAYGRSGAITDDTQMTMFTAEGLIRAHVRWLGTGICNVPMVVWRAYQRWLVTQGEQPEEPDFTLEGWLIGQKSLHARRAPGNTCLSALRAGLPGEPTRRINDSKGCGGVMRVAPVGLMPTDAFRLGCELAALTHGHPTGFLSAGALAMVISALYQGSTLPRAVQETMERLEREADYEETLSALEHAVRAAKELPARPESVETLGAGWVAEEALAISVFCALKADDFASGVLLAVNHSGDSDSTGSITGNLLGTMAGEEALPSKWVEGVEVADVLRELADDMGRVLEFSSEASEEFWRKYPGA